MRFVDTNVLIYAISVTEEERAKREVARSALLSDDLCLSTQVLGEFFHQATRPSRAGALTHDEAADQVARLHVFPVQPVTESVVVAAIATCAHYQISYWDAAIIEAARAIGSDTVLSEDLQDGQDFDGVRIVNPFR